MKYKYVKINDDKIPLNKLDLTFGFDDIKNDSAVAILVEEPYVVLDVDDGNHFDCLYNIIEEMNIKCRVMKSDRGGHFWFKTLEPIKNGVNLNTPITLKVDVKCGGKKSLVTIKKNGRWREWLKNDEEVDELPFWLTPNKYQKDLYDLKDGDGRDAQLFGYIYPLLKMGYDKEQIRKIFFIINDYVFSDPLKPSEINKMFDGNEVFEKNQISFFKGKELQHHLFADYMIDKYHIKSYGHQPYIYCENVYKYDTDEIARKMIENIDNLKRVQIGETLENIRLKVTAKDEKLDPFLITVENGILDLKTFKLLPHTPELFTTHKINCCYDENAYCEAVDTMIDNVTQNNKNLRVLIEEMLGYILLGDCRYQKAFILLGQGSNGKSKFLDMLTNWIGPENCSALALENLNSKFKTAELVNKVVNIGDDSGAELLKDSSVFKKLVTGEGVTVERKNQNPFIFRNTAKLIFSVNNLPPSVDKSTGFFRRLIIIPFNAVFTKDMPNYDPAIYFKVCTPEARSYLLNLAIKGLKKILKDNYIMEPEEVKQVSKSYELDNNNILQWIESNMDNIENRTSQQVYTDYCLFCESIKAIASSMRKFNNEIINRNSDFELVTENGKILWKRKKNN